MFPALPNEVVVLESILLTPHTHSLVSHIVTTYLFDLGHKLDSSDKHIYHKHILATMAGLLQSKWADPPAPTATQDKKQPKTEQAPEPEESVPAQPIEIPETRRKSEHTLSAAATAFAPSSPAAPPPDVSTIDEFAQTGGQEGDLFDDVIPVNESMQTRPSDDLFGDDFTPLEQPVAEQTVVEPPATEQVAVEQPAPQPAPRLAPQQNRSRGDGTRGRGRGRGRGGRKEHQGQQNHAQLESKQIEQASEEAQTPAQAPENAPTGPKKETIASVRGDRRGTGGVRKPKLTETELAEKMSTLR